MNEISIEWLKLLLLASIFIGAWLGINLGFYRTGNRSANRLLMGFVLCQLLPPINVYSQMAFGTVDWCWTITTNLTWLYGPFLLAFIQNLRGKALSPRTLLLHLAPFLVSLAWRFTPWGATSTLLAFPLFATLFAYLGYCSWIAIRCRHEITNAVGEHKTSHYYWILYLLGGLICLMLVDVFLISQLVWGQGVQKTYWQFWVACISLYLQGIALFSLVRPKVFFNDCLVIGQKLVATVKEPSQEYHELNHELATHLACTLEALMKKERPYRDNDLTLTKLGALLELNKHQTSELLNTHLKQSFYDYINKYRVAESMRLLQNEQSNLPVLDIAFEAGFNNKSTFYRLFKQHTGFTPTQFRKQDHSQTITA